MTNWGQLQKTALLKPPHPARRRNAANAMCAITAKVRYNGQTVDVKVKPGKAVKLDGALSIAPGG